MSDGIGFAEERDWPALARIWQRSFSDGPDFWAWLRGRAVWRAERTLVLRERGEIKACLLLLPCAFSGGLRAQYVYAVATDPAFRGRALMSGLLRAAARLGTARGLDLSVLLTEEDSLQGYYARFGYAPCCTVARPARAEVVDRVPFRAMTEHDLPAVAALYERACAEARRPCALRDGALWENIFALYGDHAAVTAGETPAGYCFYEPGRVLEAAGPDGAALAAACAPGAEHIDLLPAARERGAPVGCALALSARGTEAVERGTLYLNMLFN